MKKCNETNSTETLKDSFLDESIDGVGADIITDLPEIIEWILNLAKEEKKRLVICSMANLLDSEDQILLSTGMDLICETICRNYGNTALVFYISPNTAHCVSEDASRESELRLHKVPLWQKVIQSTKLAFKQQGSWPKLENSSLRVINGMARYKGHHNALAKTSQMWRAMVARSENHLVSANLGPSSRTDSMMSNKFIKLAMEGMQVVQPLVAFDVQPAKTLMASLMLYDLNFKQSSANPEIRLKHPMCLFIENAVHGGSWRCPYTVDSIGHVSYIVGIFRKEGRSPIESLSWKNWQGAIFHSHDVVLKDGKKVEQNHEENLNDSFCDTSLRSGSSSSYSRSGNSFQSIERRQTSSNRRTSSFHMRQISKKRVHDTEPHYSIEA